MRSDTQTVTIKATPETVLNFIADGANLPRWAIGFAKAATPTGGAWVVATGQGEVLTTIEVDGAVGTVDFHMDMGDAGKAVAFARVLPNETGSEFLFTQFQGPAVVDDIFEQLVATVGHELTVLKGLLEVECPL